MLSIYFCISIIVCICPVQPCCHIYEHKFVILFSSFNMWSLILVICIFTLSLLFYWCLTRGLFILLIYSRNKLLISLIFLVWSHWFSLFNFIDFSSYLCYFHPSVCFRFNLLCFIYFFMVKVQTDDLPFSYFSNVSVLRRIFFKALLQMQSTNFTC